MPSKYLCNLVIPGAAKSGTSSLHNYLGAHPMIAMSSRKEPHHFCRDAQYSKGAAAHNELFERKPDAQYFGESSTGYLPWPPAAARIARDLDSPKAIIVLRHPVARCFSHYRWRYRLGLEKRSFLDAIKNDGFGFNPEQPTKFGYMAYLEFSQYAQQSRLWEEALGVENCLFLASSDLRQDHDGTMAQCFEFLGLPSLKTRSNPENFNETATLGPPPTRVMTGLAGFLPSSFKSSPFYRRMRGKVLRVGAPVPPVAMTAEERALVTDSLEEEIAWYEARFAIRNNVD
jgi:hypothetical protein